MENTKPIGGMENEKKDNKINKEGGNKTSRKKVISLLLLGGLIGIFFKTQVFNSVVIGYNDNRLNSLRSDFDYEEYEKKKEAAEKEAAEKAATEGGQIQGESKQVESAPATGGQCGN